MSDVHVYVLYWMFTIYQPGAANIFVTSIPLEEEGAVFPDLSSSHMLEFKLKVKCTNNPKASQDSEDPNELYKDHNGKSYID